MLSRQYSQAVTHPLQTKFTENLRALWQKGGSRPRLGLAVSGGVDSMALASLCSESLTTAGSHPSFFGFVVDHRLREGSTKEAHDVAERLQTLRIDSKVLTLDWKQIGDPDSVTHIESVARSLRFQALGKACYEKGINTLLVAHHSDDQAETIMLRLLGRYFGAGLRGIQPEKPIAECHGIYGVHASGQPRALDCIEQGTPQKSPHMLVEDGGVTIARPLLQLTKEDLITYCEQVGVRWVEDATNADPTYTLRNTVRHLQKRDLLPTALRNPSLLAHAGKVAEREQSMEDIANREYAVTSTTLNLKTSQASFIIPISTPSASSVQKSAEWTTVKAMLLRKLLALVAPTEELNLQDLHTAVSFVFLGQDKPGVKERKPQKHASLQVAGVSIRRYSRNSGINEYTISRAMIEKNALTTHRICLSDTLRERSYIGQHVVASDWQLWDNRYWLRVGHSMSADNPLARLNVWVWFLTPDDLARTRQNMIYRQRKRLDSILEEAPGKIRFTLPAVFASVNTPQGNTGPVRLVALPSLSWSAESWGRWPEVGVEDRQSAQFWDIRYKKIDFGEGEGHVLAPI